MWVFSNAQKTIKVRKGRTIQGFYQLQSENKTKELLYFDKMETSLLHLEKKEKKQKVI